MVGFSDDELAPKKFVILQKAHIYGEQDKKLGMDKIHIQIEGQSRSVYGGIRAIYTDGENIKLVLNDETRLALSVDGDIEVSTIVDQTQFEKVLSKLKKICETEGILFTFEK